jgi:hypothetical protein
VYPRAGLNSVARRRNPSPSLESNPGRPAHNLVTILAELPLLLRVAHGLELFTLPIRVAVSVDLKGSTVVVRRLGPARGIDVVFVSCAVIVEVAHARDNTAC